MAWIHMSEESFSEVCHYVSVGFEFEGVNVDDPAALWAALKSLPKRINEFAEFAFLTPEELRKFLWQVVENGVKGPETVYRLTTRI